MKDNYLRVLHVYIFSKFPDWRVLLLGFHLDRHSIEGIAFTHAGKFDTLVELDCKKLGKIKHLGNIYNEPNKNSYSLLLSSPVDPTAD